MPPARVLLFPVDDTDESQRAFDWLLSNIWRNGDEVHLLNVIPRNAYAAYYGVPMMDPVPSIDREAYEAAVRKSETFIVKRFLSRVPAEMQTTCVVHIVKSEVDAESVGNIICKKGSDLQAACVIMGSHNKGPVTQFFLGSVSQYVQHHCKLPVVIVRNV